MAIIFAIHNNSIAMKGLHTTFVKGIFPIAMVLLLASCGNEATIPATKTTDQKDLYKVADKGRILFEDRCATCHGNDGTAGISNAKNLQISTLDINAVKQQINEGKNGMPPFKNQFAPEDIDKIAAYVMTLRK